MRVLFTHHFYRQTKRYTKKYPHFLCELEQNIQEISPVESISLGGKKYKARISISSLKKGRSGSFRLIFFFLEIHDIIVPITLFQKSEQNNISKSVLLDHADMVMAEIKDFFSRP